jgi:hypothetical protein
MADQRSTTCCRAQSACSCSVAGQTLFEPPGSVHLYAENLSLTEPAKILLPHVADDGALLVVFHLWAGQLEKRVSPPSPTGVIGIKLRSAAAGNSIRIHRRVLGQ